MDRAQFEQLLLRRSNRRRLLAGLAIVPIATSLPSRPTRFLAQDATPISGTNPFSLGVASGDPLPDSVVIWTRLAPEPLSGALLAEGSVKVDWEVAEDEAFKK